MNSWKKVLHKFAIQPVQSFYYTKGKNNTDSAIIIDAMDILHNNLVDGFSIVSSDSDYTRLATRIREEGLFVMGIGEKKTPEAFVKACEKFVFTELLTTITEEEKEEKVRSSKKGKVKKEIISLITQAYEMSEKGRDEVHLGELGVTIRKIEPGFDPRSYGYKRFIDILRAYPRKFKLIQRSDKGPLTYYVQIIS